MYPDSTVVHFFFLLLFNKVLQIQMRPSQSVSFFTFLFRPPGLITVLKLACVLLVPVFMLLLSVYVPIRIYSIVFVLKINIKMTLRL